MQKWYKTYYNTKSKADSKLANFTQEILSLQLKCILSKAILSSDTKHSIEKDESEYELLDKRNFNKEEFVTEG